MGNSKIGRNTVWWKKIKASMHLHSSKVINTWVEHFYASQQYLVSNARKGSSSLVGLERVSFHGAAMSLPLTMCPARAGNEFSHWTNGWQRHKPWLSGETEHIPVGKVASYSSSFVRRVKVFKSIWIARLYREKNIVLSNLWSSKGTFESRKGKPHKMGKEAFPVASYHGYPYNSWRGYSP